MRTLLRSSVIIQTVDNLLSADQCRALIDESEDLGYEDAPITTPYGFVMRKDIRDNTRVIVDDPDRAQALWQQLKEHAPPIIGDWRAIGLNERFRFYRYDRGQAFRWHFDGAFRRSPNEQSLLTLMFYLNEDFGGGATEFEDHEPVVPRTGSALLFTHAIRHQGAPVISGRKYVLRTDVMYVLNR